MNKKKEDKKDTKVIEDKDKNKKNDNAQLKVEKTESSSGKVSSF